MSAEPIVLTPRSGLDDGYRGDLPLLRECDAPIVLDASRLGPFHPMYLVRLRLFLDWHAAAGHAVKFKPPADQATAQRLVDMGLTAGVPFAREALPAAGASETDFGIRRLRSADDVEDASREATELLQEQAPALAVWGDPVYMAVSELCGNALQHGRDVLGAYVAADRVDGDRRQFRLAIADLGIGIPEHIRSRHPEWQDDTAAITRALQRGVTGTDDAHRGNGFAEVFDDALDQLLRRENSSVAVDIRSGKGRVIVDLVDGETRPRRGTVGRSRRGTWITYTITTV